jgi:hypothetical protein
MPELRPASFTMLPSFIVKENSLPGRFGDALQPGTPTKEPLYVLHPGLPK